MTKAFEHVAPEQVGVSSESILEFLKRAKEACIEMHSLTVLRHGKICAQGWWAPYAADIPHAMFSFSKSLTATAIGFAEQEGLLTLDEKLVDLFPDECPENPSENLKKADIYSLLTMSCGHEVETPLPDRESPNWIRNFLHHEFKYAPGTMFQYNTIGTNMLSAILTKKTGLTLTQYLKPRLFDRIGMSDAYCSLMPDGIIQRGGSGFKLTADDMARFAQFFLQKGKWDGEQILNESWIERGSSAQIGTVNPVFTNHDSNWRLGYGFQMWRCIPDGLYRADGAYGQFGIVIPDKDAVIAINSASTYPDDLLNIVWDTILKGMSDEEALPANPRASEELQRALEALALPMPWGVRSKNAEKSYGGVCYSAEQPLPGLLDYVGGAGKRMEMGGAMASLRFDFAEKSVCLTAGKGENVQKLNISLTGTPVVEEIGGMHYAAAGYWQGRNRFTFEARCVESASGVRITADFAPGMLSLSRTLTLPVDRGVDDEIPATATFTA